MLYHKTPKQRFFFFLLFQERPHKERKRRGKQEGEKGKDKRRKLANTNTTTKKTLPGVPQTILFITPGKIKEGTPELRRGVREGRREGKRNQEKMLPHHCLATTTPLNLIKTLPVQKKSIITQRM